MKEFKKLIVIPMVLILLTACSASSPFKSLTAGPCSGEQKQLVDDHISSQISAISKQDWPLAYSFAAKSFQDSIDLTSCLLYTSPSPRDRQKSRMPSSA